MRNYAVLHIVVDESRIFKTKERAPIMLTVEVFRPIELTLAKKPAFVELSEQLEAQQAADPLQMRSSRPASRSLAPQPRPASAQPFNPFFESNTDRERAQLLVPGRQAEAGGEEPRRASVKEQEALRKQLKADMAAFNQMRRMTDKDKQKQTFEAMAESRAAKVQTVSNYSQQKQQAPRTTRHSAGGARIEIATLNENYFKTAGKEPAKVEEESKDDELTVYHSIKENYLNYRSTSQPNTDFLLRDTTQLLTPKSGPFENKLLNPPLGTQGSDDRLLIEESAQPSRASAERGRQFVDSVVGDVDFYT